MNDVGLQSYIWYFLNTPLFEDFFTVYIYIYILILGDHSTSDNEDNSMATTTLQHYNTL